MFDQDPAQAETTRRKVYDMLVAEKMRVQGFHYPFPANGYRREGWQRLSACAGAVESGHLGPVIPRCAMAHLRAMRSIEPEISRRNL